VTAYTALVPQADSPHVTPGVARALPRWLPFVVTAVLLAFDQWVKWWAVQHLTLNQTPDPFIPGVLSFTLIYNTGAAWSLLSGAALPLAVGRLLVGAALLAYATRRTHERFLSVTLAVIASGAIGNAIDGLRQGRVTDMFYSPALSAVTRALGQGDFPIFNVADSCVVMGVLLLLIASFRRGERTESTENTPSA